MATVIVEQFNPNSGYWNKLYEVDKSEFDSKEPYKMNKYNGPIRHRIIGEEVVEKYNFTNWENSTETKKSKKKPELDIIEEELQFEVDE